MSAVGWVRWVGGVLRLPLLKCPTHGQGVAKSASPTLPWVPWSLRLPTPSGPSARRALDPRSAAVWVWGFARG